MQHFVELMEAQKRPDRKVAAVEGGRQSQGGRKDDGGGKTKQQQKKTSNLPRVRAGNYTAGQWRALSQEEQQQVWELRKQRGDKKRKSSAMGSDREEPAEPENPPQGTQPASGTAQRRNVSFTETVTSSAPDGQEQTGPMRTGRGETYFGANLANTIWRQQAIHRHNMRGGSIIMSVPSDAFRARRQEPPSVPPSASMPSALPPMPDGPPRMPPIAPPGLPPGLPPGTPPSVEPRAWGRPTSRPSDNGPPGANAGDSYASWSDWRNRGPDSNGAGR